MPLTAIFGDVHLGAEGCLEEEFKEALRSIAEKMDLILFNGDFLDSYNQEARDILDDFLVWVEKEGWKEKMVFITSGMGHEGNILYDRPEIQLLPYATLQTSEGAIIICHGHNIGLLKRAGETWREAIRHLKESLVWKENSAFPKINSTDKLIISHTHVPIYDMETGVFATGAWIRKDRKNLREQVRNDRLIGVFIIVDDENRGDPIQMKRWLLQKNL